MAALLRRLPSAATRRSFATAASSFAYDHWNEALSDAAAQLKRQGFAVVDNIFPLQVADELRREIVALKAAGCMQANATHLVRNGGTTKLEKRGIHEVEAHTLSPPGVALAPLLSAFSRDRTLLTLLTVFLECSREESLHYQTLKAQYNEGDNACFPLHFDSDEALDTRKLTALFYLNPGWRHEHGGELVLYPFPHAKQLIAPLYNRLVLFHAPSMLHRVLPCKEERICFTVWLFTRDELKKRAPATVTYEPGPATLESLLSPSVVKHAVKAVLRDEWESSICEAHPDTPARAQAIAQLRGDVALIERELESRHAGAAALLRQLRAQHAQR